MRDSLRRLVVLGFVFLLFGRDVLATWSIILIDTRTGEIAIGSCTCLEGFDLRAAVPVIVVGRGGAAAQSYVDVSGQNRILIRSRLLTGTPPQQILAQLAAQDPLHAFRQYGIADTLGRTLTFTGSGAGSWAGGVTGMIGTNLVYAIQGNVLTGQPVVTATEQAVIATQGDLAAKLMAGMEAARSMGGDGRCSCSPGNPTGCGAPPPSFTKSSHIGCMIVARQGDQDGVCNASVGCASGTYYMNFNVANQYANNPDPVFQLQSLFNTWRTSWLGRTDHHQSTVTFTSPSLPANGVTTTTAVLTLRNWQGVQLPISNAIVSVFVDATSVPGVQVGSVLSQGGGVYTFSVRGGTIPGTARLRVIVNDGSAPILLSPRASIPVVTDVLWSPASQLSVAQGGSISFLLDAGPLHAWRTYALALSNSGSAPGLQLSASATLPLVPDALFLLGLQSLNSPYFPNSLGQLSGSGAASAQFVAPSLLLAPLANTDLTFAFALISPFDFASNPRVIQLVP